VRDDFPPTTSDVTLSIGGRSYKLACAPGEEEHIAALGRTIDGKLAANPGLARQSEAQMLLYATLLLADELHERNRAPAPPPSPQGLDLLADPLERLAEKLETIAADLEGAGDNA
jgi:cell division protein ZapA